MPGQGWAQSAPLHRSISKKTLKSRVNGHYFGHPVSYNVTFLISKVALCPVYSQSTHIWWQFNDWPDNLSWNFFYLKNWLLLKYFNWLELWDQSIQPSVLLNSWFLVFVEGLKVGDNQKNPWVLSIDSDTNDQRMATTGVFFLKILYFRS